MATTITNPVKVVVLNALKARYETAYILNASNVVVNTGEAGFIGSISGTTLSNSNAMVFNMPQGAKAYKVRLIPYGVSGETIDIDLDGATGDAFTFTTAGTFTIPIGDLTISVA